MLDQELEEAARLARRAGQLLLEVYATEFDVAYKGKSNPVTEADTRANALLVDGLGKAFPDDGIVAEESPDRSAALRNGRCWYVDPLDGTKEFIAKNGEFSVMIGLAIDGAARLGIVYQPEGDKLYAGVLGNDPTEHRAWLEHAGQRRHLTVSQRDQPSNLRLVVSRSHRSDSTDRIVTRLGIQEERRSGSVGLKVGHIAEQTADLYVHVSDRSYAWDACGPEAVLRAAGGRFTDLNGNPMIYGGEDLRNARGILACNSAAFDAVLPAVREVASTTGLI